MKSTKQKSSSVIFQGGTVRIKTSVSVTLSANFQSVKLDASIEADVKREQFKQGYRKAWAVCNAQIANGLPDAKATINELGKIRSAVER